MVENPTEAESSEEDVTNPYRRTERCDGVHGYRCDVEVGVLGVDVSKEYLVVSRGGLGSSGTARRDTNGSWR